MAKNVSNRKNMSAQNRPFSLKATKKTQKVNLQTVKVDGKKVRMSTKEIKSRKTSNEFKWELAFLFTFLFYYFLLKN